METVLEVRYKENNTKSATTEKKTAQPATGQAISEQHFCWRVILGGLVKYLLYRTF